MFSMDVGDKPKTDLDKEGDGQLLTYYNINIALN